MSNLNLKLTHILSAALIATAGCMIQSCGPEQGHTLSEMHNATPSDSMLYYYGELGAVDYWHKAATDSTLSNPDSIDEYLRGVEAGLRAMEDDNDVYNRGVSDGVKLASQMMKFEKNYGINGNTTAIYNGVATGLHNKKTLDETSAHHQFYRFLNALRQKREQKEMEAGERNLRQVAGEQKMYRINSMLWCRIMTEGNGEIFKKGDIVKVHVHVNASDGRDLNITLPAKIEVGSKYGSRIYNEAIETMKSGEVSQYATTAQALLGDACERYNLMPSDILLFTIETLSVQSN